MQLEIVEAEPWDWERLRTRSFALFGSQHRLGIAALAATAAEEELYAAHLAARAGLTRGEAGRQLAALGTAGLLIPTRGRETGEGGRQPDLFARREDEAWDLIDVLAKPYRTAPRRRRSSRPRSRRAPGSRES